MPHRGLSGTNLKFARNHNVRVTLQAVRVHGPVSRPELAQIMGLTPQAIAYLCRELIDDGMIVETGRRRGGRGQPAAELSINPDGGYAVGVNIDRDHLTVLLTDLSGTVRGRVHWEENFLLPDEVFRRIERAYGSLLEDAGLEPDDLAGVGLAMPYRLGYLRTEYTPRSYAAWRDVPAADRLREITGRPVFPENDASAAAYGEIHYGLGIDYKNFFYLFMGVGLGGGLVVNGDYVPGTHGLGGEIGFIPVTNGSGQPTDNGTIETKVSMAVLYSRLKEQGIDVSTLEQLDALHKKGSETIGEWMEQGAAHLLMTLITIICVVNPEAILIGGRLPVALIDDFIVEMEKKLLPFRSNLPNFPPILRSASSPEAAAMGAAILPFSSLFLPRRRGMMIRGDT
ncbi:MAG: ROK family transcriptional regulator [Alphaproteobacteria bacterium]|nr:ROK family transcriptional regulator [Alphaproteobacteria bacterium]